MGQSVTLRTIVQVIGGMVLYLSSNKPGESQGAGIGALGCGCDITIASAVISLDTAILNSP